MTGLQESRGVEDDAAGRLGRVVDISHGFAIDASTTRVDPGARPFLLDAGSHEPFEHGERAGAFSLRRVLGHGGTVGSTTDIDGETTPACRASG